MASEIHLAKSGKTWSSLLVEDKLLLETSTGGSRAAANVHALAGESVTARPQRRKETGFSLNKNGYK